MLIEIRLYITLEKSDDQVNDGRNVIKIMFGFVTIVFDMVVLSEVPTAKPRLY